MKQSNNLNKWWVLIGTAISALMIAVDYTIVNIAIASIQKELSVNTNQSQWLMSGFGITFCAFLASMGRLADIVGRRRLLFIGIIGFGFASLGAGFSNSIISLVIFRLLQGGFGAIIFPAGMALTAAAFPAKEQGRALGIYNGVLGLGLAIGPVLGGIILNFVSWRWIFFINIPVIILSFLICFLAIKGKETKIDQKMDWFGIGLVAAILMSFVYAINQTTISGWSSTYVIYPLILSVILFILFIAVESKSDSPLLPLALFKNRGFFLGSIAYIVAVGFSWPIIFLTPLYLQHVLDYSVYYAGIALIPMTIMTAIAPPITGKIYDNKGPLVCYILLTICLVLSFGLFLIFTLDTSLILLIITFLLFGSAWGMGNGFAMPLVLSKLDNHEDAGVVSGAAITILNVAGVISLSVVTTLFHFGEQSWLSHHQTQETISHLNSSKIAFTHGFHVGIFWLMITAIILLIPTIWYILKTAPKTAK
ncbi:MFS transporter [Piscirickettsia litoralis]|uniref:MFS transporter n=1 Tax=Piscirickettsia litoralis TaxID=1891921 RepID=A0ABX3A499_9GAMM|nr:MFS transporter [Piscirickettsia litoralis]ODN43691.1 MFS transporter [Piscirickettsia litoralis]